MPDAAVLYLADLAAKLNTTESAIRNHLAKRTDAIPPGFKIGRRWAWTESDVTDWLDSRPRVAQYPSKKRGRPRLS